MRYLQLKHHIHFTKKVDLTALILSFRVASNHFCGLVYASKSDASFKMIAQNCTLRH